MTSPRTIRRLAWGAACLGVLLVLIGALILHWPGAAGAIIDERQERRDLAAPLPRPGATLEQTFTAQHDQLTAVEMVIARWSDAGSQVGGRAQHSSTLSTPGQQTAGCCARPSGLPTRWPTSKRCTGALRCCPIRPGSHITLRAGRKRRGIAPASGPTRWTATHAANCGSTGPSKGWRPELSKPFMRALPGIPWQRWVHLIGDNGGLFGADGSGAGRARIVDPAGAPRPGGSGRQTEYRGGRQPGADAVELALVEHGGRPVAGHVLFGWR